jgi:hypothetical protein
MGVVGILLMVEGEVVLLVYHLRDIKNLASVVKNGVALQRQMRREPSVRVVQCRSNDIYP